jgi:hypothetical protein
MHDPQKRITVNGIAHMVELSKLRTQGIQIIMQDNFKELVPGSMRYPIERIEQELGIKFQARYWGKPFWNGTPPYCLAMAIYEGYQNIYLIGNDMLDPKHVRQQRTMSYLMGVAHAKGIKVTGVTVRSVDDAAKVKRYGYDFGPEWDRDQNAELWDGHPIEVRYKGAMDF